MELPAFSANRVISLSKKLLLSVSVLLLACTSPPSGTGQLPSKPLRTENVVIVVIDGPRYSEFWGTTPGLIPNMATKMKKKGGFLDQFYNDAYTYTNSGHAAITTGVNQPIDNYGEELPANPSIFQYFLKQSGKPATAAWIVSSKDKLHILGDTKRADWQGSFQPSMNVGVNGPGTGYRMDSLTLVEAKRILATHKPNLMLINFMEPDGFAHAGNWDNYLRGIARNDRYVKQLWDFLRKDPFYKKSTALLITSDHGRHLDEVDGGWVNHGDNCEGCERISLLALGPDFKKRRVVEQRYTLVDIAPTVAYLLGFTMDSTVVVPTSDSTLVEIAMDSVAVAPTAADTMRTVVEMDTTTMKGHIIRELFK